MQTHQPNSAAVLAMVAALVLASAGTLVANGGAFFIPANRGPVDLVYFARVKDARTGRPIQTKPYVNIVDAFSGVYIPFQGDSPGHFRSPDIGAAIKEVSTQPIDTKQLEIVVSAAGYRTVKLANIPRRAKGTVELSVRMEPRADGDNAPSTAAPSQPVAAGGDSVPLDSSKPTFFLLAACFGLAAISAVVRTVVRPGATGR